MERLTKRLSNGEVMHNCGKCPNVNEKNFCSEKNCATVILNRLAELEDKLESGRLVELPCVKTLTDHKGVLYRVYFMNYAWGENGIIDFYSYHSEKEAEARLKELQERL